MIDPSDIPLICEELRDLAELFAIVMREATDLLGQYVATVLEAKSSCE